MAVAKEVTPEAKQVETPAQIIARLKKDNTALGEMLKDMRSQLSKQVAPERCISSTPDGRLNVFGRSFSLNSPQKPDKSIVRRSTTDGELNVVKFHELSVEKLIPLIRGIEGTTEDENGRTINGRSFKGSKGEHTVEDNAIAVVNAADGRF